MTYLLGGDVHEDVARQLDEHDDKRAEGHRADVVQDETTRALEDQAAARRPRLVSAAS